MSEQSDRNSETGQKSATTLDRLWAATRPAEPSAASWERVWGHVVAGMRETPATVPMSRASRGPWKWIALGVVAQAAAVLIAGGIYLQVHPARDNADPEVSVVAGPPAPMIHFEVNEGQTLIVQVGERADRVFIQPELVDTASLMIADLEDAPTDPYADAIAFSMDILNVMETID